MSLPYGWKAIRDSSGKIRFRNENAPLPSGWRSGVSNGRTFYINDNAKVTQWDDPRPLTDVDPRPLPQGIEQRTDPNTGRVFFMNHTTKTTSWNDPRPPLSILNNNAPITGPQFAPYAPLAPNQNYNPLQANFMAAASSLYSQPPQQQQPVQKPYTPIIPVSPPKSTIPQSGIDFNSSQPKYVDEKAQSTIQNSLRNRLQEIKAREDAFLQQHQREQQADLTPVTTTTTTTTTISEQKAKTRAEKKRLARQQKEAKRREKIAYEREAKAREEQDRLIAEAKRKAKADADKRFRFRDFQDDTVDEHAEAVMSAVDAEQEAVLLRQLEELDAHALDDMEETEWEHEQRIKQIEFDNLKAEEAKKGKDQDAIRQAFIMEAELENERRLNEIRIADMKAQQARMGTDVLAKERTRQEAEKLAAEERLRQIQLQNERAEIARKGVDQAQLERAFKAVEEAEERHRLKLIAIADARALDAAVETPQEYLERIARQEKERNKYLELKNGIARQLNQYKLDNNIEDGTTYNVISREAIVALGGAKSGETVLNYNFLANIQIVLGSGKNNVTEVDQMGQVRVYV